MGAEQARQISIAALAILAGLGGILILVYLLGGRTRSYFLYLGLAFMSWGISVMVTDLLRVVLIIAGLGALVMAVIEGVADYHDRIARFNAEQRDREDAFGEYLEAVTRLEVAEEAARKDEDAQRESS